LELKLNSFDELNNELFNTKEKLIICEKNNKEQNDQIEISNKKKKYKIQYSK
jgi:hypothetical protein